MEKVAGDRIVLLKFDGADELGGHKERNLIAQLTGRSANLFLLDEANAIISHLRAARGAGQALAERYEPPATQPVGGAKDSQRSSVIKSFTTSEGRAVSESLDAHYSAFTAQQAAQSRLSAARAEVRREISRRKKLLKQLEKDLAEHADAEQHKRIGDLLLANVGTAKRTASRVKLLDYFSEGAPEVEIEIDDKVTLPEEASRRFSMYSRSKRARKQIASRIEQVKAEIARLEQRHSQLESPDAALPSESPAPARAAKTRKDREKRIPGTRRYVSSDGYEILVGRAARDNDNLTFKIAKPNDLWLHAADYPGSHVVVRNTSRKEIPHRTLIEAAQLAAYFSRAKKDPKVTVHYTQRKFLSKPKGAAPGLVQLLRFKSITVAPAEVAQRVV